MKKKIVYLINISIEIKKIFICDTCLACKTETVTKLVDDIDPLFERITNNYTVPMYIYIIL